MKLALEDIVKDELEAIQLDLVELRIGGSRHRPVIDVRVDRRDGQKVQVGDCERASRAIEARLDSAPDVIDGRYVLEVSSPGADRPVRTIAEWRRFAGRRVNVKSARFADGGGRAEVEIVAVRGEAGHEELIVRHPTGGEIVLVPADVQEARLAFHWKP